MLKFSLISAWLVVLFAVLILFAGCGDKAEGGAAASSAWLAAETVNCETTTNKITTQGDAGLQFEAEILTPDGGTPWCSFDLITNSSLMTTKSGSVGDPIYLYMMRNLENTDRSVQIRIVFTDGYNTTLTLTQTAFSVSADYDHTWGEQPLYRPNGNYIYKTYYTTLSNGKYVRNYSICYDSNLRVAHWVSYPLHRCYTSPSVGRTDAWSYDPNNLLPIIPESAQASIVNASYGTGDARGHQCPSADRYSTVATNEMTFYATNIMPQNYNFNGGSWVNLENQIRKWAPTTVTGTRYDTLFVVTGTYFTGATITDRSGKRVGYPAKCWKVLLQQRGNQNKQISAFAATELKAIGFIFTNNQAGADTALSTAACSVADVEALTGFSFFHNLDPTVATTVKGTLTKSDWAGL